MTGWAIWGLIFGAGGVANAFAGSHDSVTIGCLILAFLSWGVSDILEAIEARGIE